LRGYDYLQFVGHNVAFANAELRFPIIEAALTPIGVIGGIRGVFFADIGGGWFNNQDFKFATSKAETIKPIVDFQRDATGAILLDPTTQLPLPVFGPDKTINGFRLKDGRASYGLGLETFALGFPIHFDWSWRTLFNSSWEDQLYSQEGADAGTTGSKWFRAPRFAVWIGYDF
jgi:outer membrane protein assembly factor BamA